MQKVVESLAETTPEFDDIWYRALTWCFFHSHRPASKQQGLIAEVNLHIYYWALTTLNLKKVPAIRSQNRASFF